MKLQGYFLRLLPLDWKAKRKEHGAKRETNEDFAHEFSPAPVFCALLSAHCALLPVI
jgi:hypothetical protein